MWVIKIGGSWIKNPNLPKLIKILMKLKKQRFVIVPGGGIFADSVRYASQLNMIKSFDKKIHVTEKIDDFKEKNLWLPSKILKNVRNFKKNWESTSDSVATWLYSKIHSEGIIFVKSISLGLEQRYKIVTLQDRGILDSNVKYYLKTKNNLRIIGPEIIQLLETYRDWDNLLKKLNFIKL
jgi:aspartokinase-like uncharacterized kinase